jgi:putative ABC transport system permease protein
VMVFYVFMAIYYNRQFFQLSQDSIKVMVLFRSSAIVVALFSIMFVWYSNGFFVRSRTKELATYALLGMERRQIALLLFLENLALGLLSLAAGIGLGGLFSQLCSALLIRMARGTASVSFAIAPHAVLLTVVLFAGLVLVTSLHTSSLIYRFRLIELFQAGHEGERTPRASVLPAILSVLFIAAGYVLADAAGSRLVAMAAIPILLLTVSGTYMLFRSVIPALVRGVRRNRMVYYQGTRMISTSQLLYRIRGNVTTLATIAVLTAVTITACGTAFTFYLGSAKVAGAQAPFSFSYVQQAPGLDAQVQQVLDGHPELEAGPVVSVQYLWVPVTYDRASTSSATTRRTLGDRAAVISKSGYDLAAQAQGRSASPVIDRGQCVVVTQQSLTHFVLPDIRVAGSVLKSLDRTVVPVVAQNQAGTMIVVADTTYAELVRRDAGKSQTVRGYMVAHPQITQAVAGELGRIIPDAAHLSSYVEVNDRWFGQFGVIAFIGLFLGLVFVFATGSIISYKQLMEAQEERARYAVLRDIGVSRGEVWQVVARQMAVVFGLPLLVGICHSAAALLALRNLIGMNILPYCALVVAVYVALYGVYYAFTVHGYVSTVA